MNLIYFSLMQVWQILFSGPFAIATHLSVFPPDLLICSFSHVPLLLKSSSRIRKSHTDAIQSYSAFSFIVDATSACSKRVPRTNCARARTRTHTHTHTHKHTHTRLTPLCPGLPAWVGRYQKGKTNLDFTEARDSEWQWNPLGHEITKIQCQKQPF